MAIINPTPPMPLPQPDPSSLADQVDWMTYSHQELYDMVNNGMDLNGAGAVADSWGSLSNTLNDLGHELNSALTASADGWQGAAADKARQSLASLVGWLHTTGDGAVGVSGCLTRQVAAANTARSGMPTPVQQQLGMMHPGTAIPAGGSTTASAFAAGPQIMRPPLQPEWQAQEAHQQAAQVMQQYQTTSYDIYRTVPEFASPTGRDSFGERKIQPGPTPHQPALPPPGSGDPVSMAPARAFTPGRPGGSGGMGGMGAEEPRGSGGGGGAGIEEGESRVGPGAESGVGSSSGAAASASADRMATGRSGQPMGGGGLGGGGGARRGEDKERRTPKYLEEDERIFTIDERTAPPVIGA